MNSMYGSLVSCSDKLSSDYYPDPMAMGSPKEARDYGEAVLRDQEYMSQLPISGYQYISGKS